MALTGNEMETPPSEDEETQVVVVASPQTGNPFCNEKAQEEAVVRSMRPATLPEMPATFRDGGVCIQPSAASPSIGCGPGQQDAAVKMVMDENRRLWTELEAFKSMMQSGANSATLGVGGSQTSMMILGGASDSSAQQGPSESARFGALWGRSDVDLLGQGVRMNFSSVLGGAFYNPVGHMAGNSMASLAGGGQGPSSMAGDGQEQSNQWPQVKGLERSCMAFCLKVLVEVVLVRLVKRFKFVEVVTEDSVALRVVLELLLLLDKVLMAMEDSNIMEVGLEPLALKELGKEMVDNNIDEVELPNLKFLVFLKWVVEDSNAMEVELEPLSPMDLDGL